MTNQERHAQQAETLRRLMGDGIKVGNKTIKISKDSRDNHGNKASTILAALEASAKS